MINAAAREFAERGYAATSLSRVMKRAGGHPGHLYYHFPTKDSLATAVIDQELTRLRRALDDRRRAGLAGLEILAGLVAQIAHDLAAGNPGSHATMTLAADPAARDAGVVLPVATWVEASAQLIDEAIGLRQIGVHLYPPEEAVSLVSALVGLYAVRHDVTDAAGSVYSFATRRCVAFFEAWGCERAVEIIEAAAERADAAGVCSEEPVLAHNAERPGIGGDRHVSGKFG